MIRLAGIWRYPVKSCIGVAVDTAALDLYGIAGDREFAVVDEHDKLLSQRGVPALNLIAAQRHGQRLYVSAPGMPDLCVDLQQEGERMQVVLHDVAVPCLAMGAAAAWFSDFLDRPARLVRSHKRFRRCLPPGVAHLFLPRQRRFPDCAPIHLIGRASLDALNARLDAPIEMARFRPNLVIEGLPPFAEDRFRTMRIGAILFEFMGVSERCAVPTIAPLTMRKAAEPLRTLRRFRSLERAVYTGIAFGAYFRPLASGRLSVGAKVDVIDEGPAPLLASSE